MGQGRGICLTQMHWPGKWMSPSQLVTLASLYSHFIGNKEGISGWKHDFSDAGWMFLHRAPFSLGSTDDCPVYHVT